MADNDFWQSMVKAAKTKTAQVVESVKKDINDLSSTVNANVLYYSDVVKHEASNIVGNISESLSLGRSPDSIPGRSPMSSFRDLWSPDTVHDEVSPMMIVDSEPVPMTEIQYRHHLLVTNPKNFTEGFPEDEQRDVDAWYAAVDANFHDFEYLGKQLSECPALGDMYRRLVPDEVTHSEFWKRYFYRRHLILDYYSEDDYDLIRNAQAPVEEDEGSSHSDRKLETLEKTADDFFTVEIDSQYGASSSTAENNDWGVEFNTERLKEKNDLSLSDLISDD
ncbi:BSD domain-containing protein 1 [Halyomorpha halys]|uniref:BSD domain-containing protein 1 n=1 Tax=Halyomorpha halys TaxID=286706 RepID=UPI0006D4D5ED|nr:BSD domain-containing protein 1-like [Halyomorpha halys]